MKYKKRSILLLKSFHCRSVYPINPDQQQTIYDQKFQPTSHTSTPPCETKKTHKIRNSREITKTNPPKTVFTLPNSLPSLLILQTSFFAVFTAAVNSHKSSSTAAASAPRYLTMDISSTSSMAPHRRRGSSTSIFRSRSCRI